jgi:hypothetical protein
MCCIASLPYKFKFSVIIVENDVVTSYTTYDKISIGAWELITTLCSSYERDIPTVILFCVSVPVLSEHITDVLPNVSTASSFRTRQFFTFACCAVSVKQTCRTEKQYSMIMKLYRMYIRSCARPFPDCWLSYLPQVA